MSSDGNIVAIGATQNDGNGSTAGHVRVFYNDGGVWTQIGNDIDGIANNNDFGSSVSLSDDGNILAAGALRNDNTSGQDSGHVRIFHNNNGSWIQIGADINGEAEWDNSGHSLATSADGSIVAIGAVFNDGVNGDDSGHVRVFEVEVPVSIVENESFKFNLYPNPVNDYFNLTFNNSHQKIDISINDILGKEIYSKTYRNTQTIAFDTNPLSSSMYFVNMVIDDTNIERTPIIKN